MLQQKYSVFTVDNCCYDTMALPAGTVTNTKDSHSMTEKSPLMNRNSNRVLYSIQFRNGDTLQSFDEDAKVSHNLIVNQSQSNASSNENNNENDNCHLNSNSESYQNNFNSSMDGESTTKYMRIDDNIAKHSFDEDSNNNNNNNNININVNSNNHNGSINNGNSHAYTNHPYIDNGITMFNPHNIDNDNNNNNNNNEKDKIHKKRKKRKRNGKHTKTTNDKNGSKFPTRQHDRQLTKKMLESYQFSSKWEELLEKQFHIKQRRSTIGTEIRAGIVSFLTLAYIILINPKVLSISGLSYDKAAASTCLSSCIATLIAGIFGNLPVGCAPGVGLSAYFSYGMMQSMKNDDMVGKNPWENGLFVSFLSGLFVFVLTLFRITPFIIDHLPHFIKVATIVGMGTFLAFIGLVDLNMIIAHSDTSQGGSILTLGDMSSWVIWLSMSNALLIAILKYYRIKGSLLIGIVLTSLIYLYIAQGWPTRFVELPSMTNPFVILSSYNTPIKTIISGGISFVLILILDVSGCTFGIGKLAGLLKDGKIEGGHWALIATSVGTMISGLTGCSPIIVAIESSSGAAAGGKTGLTAITIAVLFAISMFFGPVLGDVPPAATSPVLVFIGVLMMSHVNDIEWSNIRIALPAYVTIMMMPFTYSISNGLFFGLGSFIILYILSGKLFYNLGWLSYDPDEKYNKEDEHDAEEAERDRTRSPSISNVSMKSVHSEESINMSVASSFQSSIRFHTREFNNENNNNNNNNSNNENDNEKQIFNASRMRIDMKDDALP